MIGIIGCGASGMMAAVMAARKGIPVTVLEHNDKPGKKLLATGNGKCNLLNDNQDIRCFRGHDRDNIGKVLQAFTKEDELSVFREIGLLTKNKNGYYYPRSEQAASVVNCLYEEMNRLRIRVLYGFDVRSVRHRKGEFLVTGSCQGEPAECRFSEIILACGGLAGKNLGESSVGWDIAKSMGHTVSPCTPALVPLCLAEKKLKTVSGVRTEALVTVICGTEKQSEFGEIVWTDYGISGIPVMQLSRYASIALAEHKSARIQLNFLPEMTKDDVTAMLKQRCLSPFLGERTAEAAFGGILPGKLLYFLLCKAGIPADGIARGIRDEQIDKLSQMMTEITFDITGTRAYEFAQVTCGGVSLSEINPETMESKLRKGLYITGELLDMDGTCGGYNLQWAFATGAIAGRSIRDEVVEQPERNH